jgi:excisionase family DNA binding protein
VNEILTADEAAAILDCETRTVEDCLRAGKLPGLKIGKSWILPSKALLETLNELARENLSIRVKDPKPFPTYTPPVKGRKRVEPPSIPKFPGPQFVG